MSPYRRFHPEFHPVGMDEQCGAPRVCEIPHSDVVPETGLEPVWGCPQRFLRRSKEMDGEGPDLTKGILMLSVSTTL